MEAKEAAEMICWAHFSVYNDSLKVKGFKLYKGSLTLWIALVVVFNLFLNGCMWGFKVRDTDYTIVILCHNIWNMALDHEDNWSSFKQSQSASHCGL